jgi:glycosyltransferase involved in cell wall biosynthesis
MKLLYVTARYPYGAGESFLEPEIRALQAAGHELVLAPARPSTKRHRTDLRTQEAVVIGHSDWADRASSLIHVIKHPSLLVFIIGLLIKSPRNALKNSVVFGRGVQLGRICSVHEVQHIHAHWISTPATVASVAGKVAGLPFSVTAHRGDIVSENLLSEKAESASFVRFISNSGQRLFLERARQGPLGRFEVIPMGVDVNMATLPHRFDPQRFRVACPANLTAVKGHRYLLEAARLVHESGVNMTLHLYGSGELDAELRELAQNLGISHIVEFAGQVDHKELLARFADRAFDCVVLPSVDLGSGLHEGIPVTLMEAMAAGVPIVATRTGGIPELLIGVYEAMLAEPANADQLAERLRWLATNPAMCSSLSRVGLEIVQERFNVTEVARQLGGLICHGR